MNPKGASLSGNTSMFVNKSSGWMRTSSFTFVQVLPENGQSGLIFFGGFSFECAHCVHVHMINRTVFSMKATIFPIAFLSSFMRWKTTQLNENFDSLLISISFGYTFRLHFMRNTNSFSYNTINIRFSSIGST